MAISVEISGQYTISLMSSAKQRCCVTWLDRDRIVPTMGRECDKCGYKMGIKIGHVHVIRSTVIGAADFMPKRM